MAGQSATTLPHGQDMCAHVCFTPHPFLGEWQWVTVCCQAWTVVAATLYVSWVLPIDCLSYSRQCCSTQGAWRTSIFPPPLAGSGVRVCVWHGGPCQFSSLLRLPLWPAVPPPVCTCARVHFPLSSLFGGVVVGCGYHHEAGQWLWMPAGKFPWIALAMVGAALGG
jgi:hypothetical protein